MLITRFWFDAEGSPIKDRRHHLYDVERVGDATFAQDVTDTALRPEAVIRRLEENSWGNAQPVRSVQTHYAAVNGIQNDLQKASWLMGAHLDVHHARDRDCETHQDGERHSTGRAPLAKRAQEPGCSFDRYTLFHSPTHGFVQDVLAAGRDKSWMQQVFRLDSTDNAYHLATVLCDIQRRRQPVHWLVHSRGAVVFARAVRIALTISSRDLSHNSVSLHGIASNRWRIADTCESAGIKIRSIRNNPYDLVPNIVGANSVSRVWRKAAVPCGGLMRSLMLLDQLGKRGNALSSPHTLPYLGMDAYIKQLEFCGRRTRAKLASALRPRRAHDGIWKFEE